MICRASYLPSKVPTAPPPPDDSLGRPMTSTQLKLLPVTYLRRDDEKVSLAQSLLLLAEHRYPLRFLPRLEEPVSPAASFSPLSSFPSLTIVSFNNSSLRF